MKPGLSEHPVGSDIMCTYVAERYSNHGARVRGAITYRKNWILSMKMMTWVSIAL